MPAKPPRDGEAGGGDSPRSARNYEAGRGSGRAARGHTFRGVRLGLRIVAALCSLLVLLGSGYAWATYRQFSVNVKRIDAFGGPKSAAAAKNVDGADQNILIVGNDDRQTATDAELRQLGTTRDGGTLNTDTMMLLHLPANGSSATVISFPRDSYVSIPGHGKDKLNAAYVDGVRDGNGNRASGAQLLIKTVENLSGLSIDHFVQVDLLGFYRISLAIGGVDVCLNATVKEAKSGIDLHAGHQLISGTQALAFVRQRYGFPDGEGDLDRIKRQQYFLSAVFRKISSAGTLLNPFRLQKLLGAVTSSLQIDGDAPGHAGLDLLKLAQQTRRLQSGNLIFTPIPTKGFADVRVGSVVVVDTAALPGFIDNLIGTPAVLALRNAKAAAPGSFTVKVVNDTNTIGLETKNAAALDSAGFKTAIPQPTSDIAAQTTIRYPSGLESQAKALQLQVPGAVMDRSPSVSAVTLVLGTNGMQVKSLMPTKAPTAAPTTGAPTTTGQPVVRKASDAGCIN